MTTPVVTEIESSRVARDVRRDEYAAQHAANLAFTHDESTALAYFAAYNTRCATR